jgi:DNA-binding LytR/AlgR family response regulator
MSSPLPPLRIFYLEDNPLIVFHVEAMIEDLGHIFAGSAGSFADLMADFDTLEMDGALIDIDLADGRTGPAAALWLQERGVASIFVTGQAEVAAEHRRVTIGTIAKPVAMNDLGEKLGILREHLNSHSNARG